MPSHGRYPAIPPRGVHLVALCVLVLASPGLSYAEDAPGGGTYLSNRYFQGRGNAPAPDDTIQVTGTIPYLSGVASGSAYVYLGAGHATIQNPVVVVEGFDFNNDLGANELYELLNQENLVEELRAMGYDALVLDFADATDYIQRNAFLLVELLGTVEAMIDPGLTYPLVGASMGGLVSRYALAYMETNAIPHRVETYVSFDSPHAGANIPLGMQYWLAFFQGESEDAAAFLAALDSPAARQMLVYHHTDPAGTTGEADPLRADWGADLAAVGGYPTTTRNVAISNGSGVGTAGGQGFSPGDQIIEWDYDTIVVRVLGNVFAVSDGPGQLVFDGALLFFGLGDTQEVQVSGTRAFDGAPGGYRSSMMELAAAEAPFGDILALHPNHAFIPTISAIDLDTEELFYDVLGDPDAASLSPFDAFYVPAENQAHVLVTPENKAFILAEILPSVSVGDPAPIPRPLSLRATPNPFGASTVLAFEGAAGPASLGIYDVTGKRVASLSPDARDDVTSVRWDGRDAAGRGVAPGIYLVRLEVGDRVTTHKIVRR